MHIAQLNLEGVSEMSKDTSLFGEDYNTHFDPNVYISSYYTVLDKTVEGGLLEFLIEGIHDIFSSGNVGGKRLLDIGTGPIPHTVMPGLPCIEEIYLTDFSSVNKKYLQDAMFGSGTQTYSAILQYITSIRNKQEPWNDLLVDLKNKVRGVFSLDLLKENIFVDNYFPLFDIITSSLCIEAAAPSVEAYEAIAKRISACLKPGGHLILAGVLDQKFYMVGEHKFFSLSISQEELKRCWQSAGFTISKWDELKGPSTDNEYSDFGSCFVMHCIKNN